MTEPTQTSRSLTNLLALVAAILGGLAVLYTVYWFSLAQSLKATFIGWLDQRAVSGRSAAVQRVTVAGFPATLVLHLTDFSLGGSDGKGAAWSWKADTARLESSPWNPQRYRLDLSGHHALHFSTDGEDFIYNASVKRLTVAATLGFDGFPEQASAEVKDMHLTPVNTAPLIALGSLLLSFSTNDGDVEPLRFSLELETFKGPNLIGSPFGGDYRRVVINGRQTGRLAYRPPLLSALADWRDKGGTLEFDRLAFDHGPILLSADGTVSLDSRMQPLAAFATRSEGFFEAVDGLRKLGMVASGDATLAKIVLGVLSKPSRNGGRPYIDMPVSIKNGAVHAGPVPLLRLKPIDWSFLAVVDTALRQ